VLDDVCCASRPRFVAPVLQVHTLVDTLDESGHDTSLASGEGDDTSHASHFAITDAACVQAQTAAPASESGGGARMMIRVCLGSLPLSRHWSSSQLAQSAPGHVSLQVMSLLLPTQLYEFPILYLHQGLPPPPLPCYTCIVCV
jgi:hypothetical protein